MFLFIANYGRKLRIEVDIRRNKCSIKKDTRKHEVEQAVRGRKKVEEMKKSNKVILNINDLVFKEKLVKKLVDQYISSYIIDVVATTYHKGQMITQ